VDIMILTDEEILNINPRLAVCDARAIEAAIIAKLGEPVAWMFTNAWGTHYTDDKRDWLDAIGIESVTPLYALPEVKE
jgi:hypothetical protein